MGFPLFSEVKGKQNLQGWLQFLEGCLAGWGATAPGDQDDLCQQQSHFVSGECSKVELCCTK